MSIRSIFRTIASVFVIAAFLAACGVMLEAESLLDPVCSECGSPVELTPTTQLFLRMDELAPRLRAYVDAHPEWRRSVRTLTTRFLDEGLGDRALTRDMDWGISVPRVGFDDKRIFLWAENVLGYLSASQKVCEANYWDFDALWQGEESRHYYVHGRNNIPYHTFFLPSLLMAQGEGWHLPDVHVASEHMTYQGRTISGQGDHPVINANKLLERWPADLIRYYFLSCGVDKKDTDFDEADLVERCNRDLAGVCGNFIQRTLAFVARYLEGHTAIPIVVVTDQREEVVKSGADVPLIVLKQFKDLAEIKVAERS